tara:strand:+ start:46319 stop:47176 length:858 start_codon:yes stop_codon:yes gene_type:complete
MFKRIISILRFGRGARIVGVIRLDGVIGGGTFRSGLTDERLGPVIEKVFKIKKLKAVAIIINSPGGSPAQSSLLHQRIRRLSKEKNIPVIAFVEDVAASGGYWLAVSADEIFVNANSIVGSIGVIYSGFGFTKAIEKLGVERRLHTAGENKSLLDPFLPEEDEDIERLAVIQEKLHKNFISIVQSRRGQRLKPNTTNLYSGDFWLGESALELGLVDGIGELVGIMKERFGQDVRLRHIGLKKGWFRRRLSFPGSGGERMADMGGSMALGVISALESKAFWSRYGL